MIKSIIKYFTNNFKPLYETMNVDLNHVAMIKDFSKENIRALLDFEEKETGISSNIGLSEGLKQSIFYEGRLLSVLNWNTNTIKAQENLVTLIDSLIMTFNQYLVFCPVIPEEFSIPYLIELDKVFTYLQEPFQKEIKLKLNSSSITEKDYKSKVETCLEYFEAFSKWCNSEINTNKDHI